VSDADVARLLPIIGYFAELQERHAMTQTSEPGIKSEHSEGERTRGNGVVAEVPELWIIDDEFWQAVKTRQSEIADKYVNVTEAIREAQSNRLISKRAAAFPEIHAAKPGSRK
jgi:hypothetical protein